MAKQHTVKLKRSAVEGRAPDTGSLSLGELAINTYDGKIFFEKSGSFERSEVQKIWKGKFFNFLSHPFGEKEHKVFFQWC